MRPTSLQFKSAAAQAIQNPALQSALKNLSAQQPERRRQAIKSISLWEQWRQEAALIKDHVLSDLDWYLCQFEKNVLAQGGQVHWCATPEQARQVVLKICQDQKAKKIIKGKTMVGEEIGLNPFLESQGIEPIETDLGEHIIQIRKEMPSHIVVPAVHLTKEEIAADFRRHHQEFPIDRPLDDPEALVAEARQLLRPAFVEAEVGLTGANFLIADQGKVVLITNEGNGDLCHSLPKTHIVLTGIEKVLPSLDQLPVFLRLLARSATGQDITVYTSILGGPKRPGDIDGPENFYVILLDNGRSKLLGSEFEAILKCIRCGACLNHCPVYGAVGGHAYGWVYPGPIGAILNPHMIGIEEARHLPQASSLCGRCEEVCPVKIPIPKLLRRWREIGWRAWQPAVAELILLRLWVWLAKRQKLYQVFTSVLTKILPYVGWLPFTQSWRQGRVLPKGQGKSFHQLVRQREKKHEP